MFLDTSFCIDLLREQHRAQRGPATRKLEALGPVPLRVSVFVLCELHAGARLSLRPRREVGRVQRFAAYVNVVYPDETFATAYGEVESLLRRNGTPLPVMDLLIGITAKYHGIPLLTRDVAHYQLLDGLVIESY